MWRLFVSEALLNSICRWISSYTASVKHHSLFGARTSKLHSLNVGAEKRGWGLLKLQIPSTGMPRNRVAVGK
jgi:hypothetical protein